MWMLTSPSGLRLIPSVGIVFKSYALFKALKVVFLVLFSFSFLGKYPLYGFSQPEGFSFLFIPG